MTLKQSLLHLCEQQGKHKKYWIAYSGGMDSHVLLDVAATLHREHGFAFHVIHVNHHISAHASQWAEHCEKITAKYQLPFILESLSMSGLAHPRSRNLSAGASKPTQNLEAIARKARYAILKQYIGNNDVLLTAHHQDDQAETVMLQLLRGSGTKGLSAMPAEKPFSQGILARPFLNFSRQILECYAQQHQLSWIEDESNQDTSYARNFLRTNIFPLLKQYWPNAQAAIARSASHCSELQTLNDEVLQSSYEQVKGFSAHTLSIPALLTFSPQIQRALLRMWIHRQGFILPNTKKLLQLQESVLTAARDRFPYIKWQDTEVRRFRDHLYIMPHLPMHNPEVIYSWDICHSQLSIPNVAQLSAKQPLPSGVTVRFRKGGETLHIPKRGNLTLKNLFNEWNIPTWLRDRWPLIYVNETLQGVAGFFCAIDIDCELQDILARTISS